MNLSLAIVESYDIKDTAQVAFLNRYTSLQGPKEELLGLLPLWIQTRGADISNVMDEGLRSMTGIIIGATTILQSKINHKIFMFHCIIHQGTLCAQTFPVEIVEVMD